MSGSYSRTTHRGVQWERDGSGKISFYDASGGRWVQWAPGVDAPPLPPKWQLLGVPTRVPRPGWRSPWRIIPAVLIVGAVILAIFQSLAPSPNNTAKEAKASAALLGKCLAKSGSNRFSTQPVPCNSPKAAIRVVAVVPSDPPTPCPANTKAVLFEMAGVAHPHLECVVPVSPSG